MFIRIRCFYFKCKILKLRTDKVSLENWKISSLGPGVLFGWATTILMYWAMIFMVFAVKLFLKERKRPYDAELSSGSAALTLSSGP